MYAPQTAFSHVTISVHMYTNGNMAPIFDIQRRRKREKTIRVLKMIALGVFMLGIGAVPPPWAIPRIIRELVSKDTPENRRRVRRQIYSLKRQGYIRTGKQRYELTARGKDVTQEISLWDIKIPLPKSWKGMWYIVAFDIPAEKSKIRIPFIRHLQNLGLVFYQRSVWIYPHSLEAQVRKISDYYGITNYVSFITAVSVDGSSALKKRFKVA